MDLESRRVMTSCVHHAVHRGGPKSPVWTAPRIQGCDETKDFGSNCVHVSGLLARYRDRWPRWVPRPSPKQSGGFDSQDSNRVLWILGSTESHLIALSLPGTDARPCRRWYCWHRLVRYRSPCRSGYCVAQSRPNPLGGSIARSSPRSRSTIACKASAVLLSCWFSGNASSQTAYSA